MTSLERRRRWQVVASFLSLLTMVAGRQLTIGDFSSINQVLQETEFELPTMSRTEDSTTLQLSNIRCRNVQIGDIQLEYTPTTTGLDIAIDIIGLDVVCQANYNYDGRLLAGQGDVQITSSSNAATVQASLAQATATIPPSSIQLNACNPSVNINNIDFDNGGFLGWVLNLIERLARGIMENLVEDMLCQQLQQALDNAQGLLEQLNEKLDNYSVDLSIDPLQAEHGLDSTTSFLDFSDPQTNVGLWVHQALDQGVAYLQATVQGTTDSSTEMRANIMMREYVLNSDRAFVILEESRTLFYNHDDFLETNIQLQKVQLLGLDTLTALDPFSIIGKYTIQSHVAWEYLALDVDATVDMRPSNLDNSLVTGDAGLLEDVHVVVGLGEIKTTLALLATLHQEQIESLQVGSLLSTANVLPCLVSTVGQMELSSLFIEAGDLYSPYLTGIDSVGLDRILGNILDVLFILYEMVVLQRAPAMFQQDFREMVNQRFLQEYFEIASTVCPPPTLSGSLTNAPESFVDFRDLLLNPVDSFIRGGLGTEPYGDLLSSFVTPNLEAQLMSADQFNERFVKPATRAQSGMAGSLQWPDWVIFNHTSAATTLYDAAIVYVSNLRVYNLDTVIAPLNFLDARGWNELFQTITFANQTRPLNITASILLAIGGEWSPLAMTNQIDVTIEIPSTTLSVGISANMKENEFLQVRLVDLVNPYCWLSTLAPYTDGESITLDALVIETVTVVLDTFRLNSKCISCSSPGAFLLSEILRDDLPAIGFQDVFTSRVLDLIEDVSWNLVRDYDLQGLLEDARSKCSQTNEAGRELFPLQKANEFNRDVGQARREGSAESGILSIDSIETLLGFGLVALQAMCVIVASNQAALMEGGISKESMGSSVFKETSNSSSSFVDWTNLSAVMGTWADFAFEEVRKYLLTPVDKNTEGEKAVPVPEFVSLLRENILDDGGAYVMDLVGTNAMIKWLDVEIVASQVQVLGLEDLSVNEILAPVQPHLLRSQFHFDVLTVTVDATLKHGDTTERVSFVYSAKNISTELDLFVAMDINPIQEVRIGSIFDTSNIFSCIALGLHNIQIHQIKTSIESIDGLQVSGFLQDNFHTSVNSMLQQLSERHQNDIVSALPVFLDHTFKDVVNALMPDLVTSIQNKCPAPPLYPEAGLVDFRDLLLSNDSSLALGGMGKMPYGNLFQKLYDLFVQNVLRTGPSNRPVINEIFRHITTHQSNASGVLTLQENVFSTHTSMKIAGLEADFAFQVSNITLENIDSVGEPLELIKPMNKSAYVVENTLSFGVDAKPLRMEATILLAVSDGGKPLSRP